MTFKPRILKMLADKENLKGYSKNTIRYESKCMKCSKLFIGHCPMDDDVRFKRICTKCKYRLIQRDIEEGEAYL